MSACPLCGGATAVIAHKQAARSDRNFAFAECAPCQFVHVVEPRTDFDELYGEAYYAGDGVDPSVDYVREMTDPRSIRTHEWAGVTRAVAALGVAPPARWLDFGCGLGGLVRTARAQGYEAYGYESGWAGGELPRLGIERIDHDRLADHHGSFDVVSAIEVLEHVIDPIAELRTIRTLLRPGGTLFLTTGNLVPFRARFEKWGYVLGDIHVSYFSPHALAVALRAAGFEPRPVAGLVGFDGIVRYRVLAALGQHRDHPLHRAVPWKLAARVVDRRYRLSDQPIGVATGGSS